MKIGFIGLGTMGRHMACNLIKAGHELVVHDVRREAAAPHLQAGAGWAETPRGVAEATLATILGREHKVPMRLANITLEEMTEALNRGWGERDSRIPMLLQEERAGVEIRVPEAAIRQVLELEKSGPASPGTVL